VRDHPAGERQHRRPGGARRPPRADPGRRGRDRRRPRVAGVAGPDRPGHHHRGVAGHPGQPEGEHLPDHREVRHRADHDLPGPVGRLLRPGRPGGPGGGGDRHQPGPPADSVLPGPDRPRPRVRPAPLASRSAGGDAKKVGDLGGLPPAVPQPAPRAGRPHRPAPTDERPVSVSPQGVEASRPGRDSNYESLPAGPHPVRTTWRESLPRFLAIDADAHGLFVAAATLRGGGAITIEHALALGDETAPLSPANAADLGARLKDLLRQAGVRPAPVLLCIGRDRVIPKAVRHPPTAPAEEPAVVRFQAVRELTENADDVLMDYVPVGEPTAGERQALAVFVRKQVVQAARQMCEAAGLKLAAVTPRPFAALAAARHAFATGAAPAPDAPTSPVAVVTLWDRGGEFTVARAPT